jgi:hypothetical protein
MAHLPEHSSPKYTKFNIELSRWDEKLTTENVKELYFSNETIVNQEFTTLSQIINNNLHLTISFKNGEPLGLSYSNPNESGIGGINITTLGELVDFLRSYE